MQSRMEASEDGMQTCYLPFYFCFALLGPTCRDSSTAMMAPWRRQIFSRDVALVKRLVEEGAMEEQDEKPERKDPHDLLR